MLRHVDNRRTQSPEAKKLCSSSSLVRPPGPLALPLATSSACIVSFLPLSAEPTMDVCVQAHVVDQSVRSMEAAWSRCPTGWD